MNIGEMHIAFSIGVDKIDSKQVPPFEDEEIDLLLNQGQDRFVKQRYQGNNAYRTSFEQTQKRIDDLRTIVVREYGLVGLFAGEANVYDFTVPRDYDYLTNLRLYVGRAKCGKKFSDTDSSTGKVREHIITNHRSLLADFLVLQNGISGLQGVGLNDVDIEFEWVRGTQTQHDDLGQLLSDPFNKPEFNDPLYLFEGEKILFYANKDFAISLVEITYIRKLKRLTSFPQEIIDDPVKFTDICELPAHVHQEIINISVQLTLENIESPRWQTQKIENTTME